VVDQWEDVQAQEEDAQAQWNDVQAQEEDVQAQWKDVQAQYEDVQLSRKIEWLNGKMGRLNFCVVAEESVPV
jgi:hypothetical protein